MEDPWDIILVKGYSGSAIGLVAMNNSKVYYEAWPACASNDKSRLLHFDFEKPPNELTVAYVTSSSLASISMLLLTYNKYTS